MSAVQLYDFHSGLTTCAFSTAVTQAICEPSTGRRLQSITFAAAGLILLLCAGARFSSPDGTFVAFASRAFLKWLANSSAVGLTSLAADRGR